MKYLKEAEVRDVLRKYDKEEISFSRMVELMNEYIDAKVQHEIYTLQYSMGSEWIDGDELKRKLKF